MEKKESPNKKESVSQRQAGGSPPAKGKLSKVSGGLFSVVKLTLGICLIPFVYFATVGFLSEFSLIDSALQARFWGGIVVLLVVYLFIWEPVKIYSAGHKLLEIMFAFFKPMVNVAPYLLPIYAIVIFIGYCLLSLAIKEGWLINAFVFLFGMSFALHIIFASKAIRSKKDDFLKANYIFGFCFIYLINIGLLSFCFSLIFKEFSFVSFCNSSYKEASGVFYAIFKQLFL